MGVLKDLVEIADNRRNRFVDDWKNQNKRVIGYTCTYVPEEIFYAVDILPYRISGKGVNDTSLADAHLARVNCSFARCCLEVGISGGFDFLDGVVFLTSCDHMRRCYYNWKMHEKALPFMHMLPVPHLITEDALQYYKEEVLFLKEAVEKHFDVKITPQRLGEAISLYNETRRLLGKLYDLRAADVPQFTGAETLSILSAGSKMPKTEFNGMLSNLLAETEKGPKTSDGQIRLLVAGSLMDEPDFLENVEDLGAVVVADTMCYGARTFWGMVDEDIDPIDALVDRYFNHPSCPRMVGEYKQRLAFLKDQAGKARIDGVILEAIKFCDLSGTDNALLKHDLEKAGIPVVELERQYGPLADAGRIRTRVQAFIERIGR